MTDFDHYDNSNHIGQYFLTASVHELGQSVCTDQMTDFDRLDSVILLATTYWLRCNSNYSSQYVVAKWLIFTHLTLDIAYWLSVSVN